MVMDKVLVIAEGSREAGALAGPVTALNYEVRTAGSARAALESVRSGFPDLVVLDAGLRGNPGHETCRRIKAEAAGATLPVIMLLSSDNGEEREAGLEAGADDFLVKPTHREALVARVRTLLRAKTVIESATRQARELEQMNRSLTAQVHRLRRFFSPAVADVILNSEHAQMLESHRREIAVVCCDLRGFTAFAELASPEQTVAMLRDYHREVGNLIAEFEGTVDHVAGDGFLVFFNDPVECENPVFRAVSLSVAMRGRVSECIAEWRERGFEIGFGIGVDFGMASIGVIGCESLLGYAATGPTINLAARLCQHARDGEILVSSKVRTTLDAPASFEFVGDLAVKGFGRPVPAHNLVALRGRSRRRPRAAWGQAVTRVYPVADAPVYDSASA